MICLYHGTNVVFDVIDPLKGRRGTDFGQGFYLTPNVESAARMARRVAMRKGGDPVVLCYAVDERDFQNLCVRDFPVIDFAWLRFIVANRYGVLSAVEHNLDRHLDIVHGLVADDKVVQILDDLRNDLISENEALAKLRSAPFQTVQYSFHTERAVALLNRQDVRHV